MKTVTVIAQEIISREGGFSSDPDDPGGPTKMGVTLTTLRRLGIDITQDGKIDIADLRSLSKGQVVNIYIEHYFKRPGIGALPEVIQASVFDMYVNAGSNAVKILQALLSDMGFVCIQDGVIGPQTIRMAQHAYDAAPDHLADAYGVARRNYYYAICDRRPQSRKYARRRDGGKGGWITRAEEFISAKYHLSMTEHTKRIRAWD